MVYNNLFVFLEPVNEPRPTYNCGQLEQGSSRRGSSELKNGSVRRGRQSKCQKSPRSEEFQNYRRGYFGSTLLASKAVARPHTELELCINSNTIQLYTHTCFHNCFVTIPSTIRKHTNIVD